MSVSMFSSTHQPKNVTYIFFVLELFPENLHVSYTNIFSVFLFPKITLHICVHDSGNYTEKKCFGILFSGNLSSVT